MADHALEDPVRAHDRLVDLRASFARELDRALAPFTREVRQLVVERFERLAAAAVADPVLLQLVREAYAHFENPESAVDIADWLKTARQFVPREDR